MDGARVRELGQKMMEHAKRRPREVVVGVVAVVVLILGVVSCQTTPRGTAVKPMGEGIGEPEVRVRIKSGAASVKIAGAGQFAIQPLSGDPAIMDGPLVVSATGTGCRVVDAKGKAKDFAGLSALDVVPGEKDSAGLPAKVQVDGVTYPGRIRVIPRGARGGGQAWVDPGAIIVGDAVGRGILAAPEPVGKGHGPAEEPLTRGTGTEEKKHGQPEEPVARGTNGQPTSPRGKSTDRGGTAIGGTGTGKLDVVEFLPMENYLTGVVGAELYKEWPLTAFEVQAVCARTYALHERERSQKLGRDYDLESTTADQAYNGGTPLPVAIKAAAETRGVAITWQGRLLRAYYSSTCGGRTASAADIWPTGPGYEFNLDLPIQAAHRETMCQASPRYRWEAVRDRTELSRRIREWGRANGHPISGMGLLSVVRVAGVNSDERPNKYTVEDDKKRTFAIDCEQLRQACSATVAGLAEIPKEQKVWASDFEFDVKGQTVTIRGRGFGHGVGMCQFCTKAFAERGDNWRDIVLRYYPGAKLERAY